MNKTKKNILITFSIIFALIFVLSSAFVVPVPAYAYETSTNLQASYEQQNVMTDLTNSVIAGEKFDVSNYPINMQGVPQLISLVEFCYSARSTSQSDYALYAYVYNPQGLQFDTTTTRNKIQMAFGENGSYSKYELQYLNCSTARGYEGIFYKFKVFLTARILKNVLSELSQEKRVYRVSGIELSVENVVHEYTAATTFTYSGFSKGCGSSSATESTLSCSVDGMDKYIKLDIRQTVYRPQGDYYEGKQSQLNSCYFRVPEKFFTSFGELSKIACEWYEYMTQPVLVTETNYLYQRLFNLHGADVDNVDSTGYFLITLNGNTDTSWFGSSGETFGYFTNYHDYKDDYFFALSGEGLSDLGVKGFTSNAVLFDNFSAVFYANGSYKDRYVSAEELESQLYANSEVQGAPYLTERYSEKLFCDYVNAGHTRGYNNKVIKSDDMLDIFWNITTKNLWQTIFGGYDVSTIYDSVKAIITVTANDLKGSDEEISQRLYVSQNDVKSLKAEFEKCNNERLVLFRFASSDYYSIPCTESYVSASADKVDEVLVKDYLQKWNKGEYSAYVAQETTFLDFDIISLWFKSKDAETEIPVVSSPQDVISSIEPPLEEDYHNEGYKDKLKLIIAILLVALAVVFIIWVIVKLKPIKVVNKNTSSDNSTRKRRRKR